MSTRELFFDAVDMNAVKAEQHDGAHFGGPAEARATTREGGREGEGEGTGLAVDDERQHSPPDLLTTPPPQRAAAAAPVPAATASPPITAFELRLAASAALRLAVEAVDALHALKEAVLGIADDVLDIAGDVRGLLEATRRAGGGRRAHGRRRSAASSAAAARRRSGGSLGVRTRAQARRSRR